MIDFLLQCSLAGEYTFTLLLYPIWCLFLCILDELRLLLILLISLSGILSFVLVAISGVSSSSKKLAFISSWTSYLSSARIISLHDETSI